MTSSQASQGGWYTLPKTNSFPSSESPRFLGKTTIFRGVESLLVSRSEMGATWIPEKSPPVPWWQSHGLSVDRRIMVKSLLNQLSLNMKNIWKMQMCKKRARFETLEFSFFKRREASGLVILNIRNEPSAFLWKWCASLRDP